MSRSTMLFMTTASAMGAVVAYVVLDIRAPLRESVAATQWIVLAWSLGAAAAAAIALFFAVVRQGRLLRWEYKVFNPVAVLAVSLLTLAPAAWVAYLLLVSVPDAKLKLLVNDLTNRDPALLENARPFADQLARGLAATDLGFLIALNSTGQEFHKDGKYVIDLATAVYGYPSLAGTAAERIGWKTLMERLTLKDSGNARRPLVIIGNRANYADREKTLKELESQRQELRNLAANEAHAFLRDASDRFDDLISRIQIEEPMPEAIDELGKWVSKLKSRTEADLTAKRRTEHEKVWSGYLYAIAPALDAIKKPNQAGPVIESLDAGMKLFETHVNHSKKKADPPWWVFWKKQVRTYVPHMEGNSPRLGLLPAAPWKSLENLGVQGRGQRDDLDKRLTIFREYIETTLRKPDTEPVEPPVLPAPGISFPGSWTPAGVEAIVRTNLGLERWKDVKFESGGKKGSEVLVVIQSEWAVLWLTVTPQNTPELKDAVKAAQAVAMLKIKLFLSYYGEVLNERVAKVKRENFNNAGEFREPFRTHPNSPFRDDQNREQLKKWLTTLMGFSPATVDSAPTGPHFVGQIECTKDATTMAEKAIVTFDRICSANSKPGDVDWQYAALWWNIFFGTTGNERAGFNPFESANEVRKEARLTGADGKEIAVGGLTDTDEASLRSYSQPRPAAGVAVPPIENKPPVK